MQLAPIHNHDLLTIRGQYGYRPALPVIGGSEGLGVDNVFSTATPGWMGAAKSLLGDGLASAAVDSIGGRASAELMALLGENGVLVSFGALSGELRLPVEAVLICPTSRRQPPQACGRARKGKVLLRA